MPPSYLYHFRIFLPHINWICTLENIYYTQHFKFFGWAAEEIHINKIQICQDKVFLHRIKFLWGKWRHNVWDMLIYLNIKEGEDEWKNPLISHENNELSTVLHTVNISNFVIQYLLESAFLFFICTYLTSLHINDWRGFFILFWILLLWIKPLHSLGTPSSVGRDSPKDNLAADILQLC